MPLTLAPRALSRRDYLRGIAGVAVSGASGTTSSVAGAVEDLKEPGGRVQSEAWALLSDTHIAADRDLRARGVNMASHLLQAVSEVLLAHRSTPFEGLIVNGDCAYLNGQAGDYRTFASLLEPVSACGIPIHLTLGNHDDREQLARGIQDHLRRAIRSRTAAIPDEISVPGKRVAKVRGAFCDWYLLDSLEHVNRTPGLLGEAQLQWLEAQLANETERPALVMVHHNPQLQASLLTTGLRDTEDFVDLLVSHAQVKALFFGHTHVAKTTEHRGLHLVNLPACAYRFRDTEPTGWTRAVVDATSCTLELFESTQTHTVHGRKIRIAWR